jgi:hypothetical protein
VALRNARNIRAQSIRRLRVRGAVMLVVIGRSAAPHAEAQ